MKQYRQVISLLAFLLLQACQTTQDPNYNLSYKNLDPNYQLSFKNLIIGDTPLNPALLPYQQIDNHVAHKLNLEVPSDKTPPYYIEMSANAIKSWLAKPHILIGKSARGQPFEQWFFPDGSLVNFNNGIAQFGFKYQIFQTKICFKYLSPNKSWCATPNKTPKGIFFKVSSGFSDYQDKPIGYWIYANSQTIPTKMTGKEFFTKLRNGSAEQVFTLLEN